MIAKYIKPACAFAVCSIVAASAFAAGDPPALPAADKVKRLSRPPAAQVREQVLRATAPLTADEPALAAAVAAMWKDVDAADDLLERVARTAALLDDRAAELVRVCSGPTEPWLVPDQRWLDEPSVDRWLGDQLKLYFGRWLAQRKMYDRTLKSLAGLEPTDVVDPASLLFYQGAAYHHQLRKAPGLRAIDRLLNDTADCPSRFQVVAGLMREDLKKLEDESLDHISRRMEDIRRRLDFGNADRRTRRIEDGVIDSLDKMIEELEKQRQQQQGGGGGGQSSQPMQDSQTARQKGPGQTDRKDIGLKSDWGDLTPETRDQIKQDIGKELPSHYYELIQQYFNNPQAAAPGR